MALELPLSTQVKIVSNFSTLLYWGISCIYRREIQKKHITNHCRLVTHTRYDTVTNTFNTLKTFISLRLKAYFWNGQKGETIIVFLIKWQRNWKAMIYIYDKKVLFVQKYQVVLNLFCWIDSNVNWFASGVCHVHL